jgi:hypothetical protein
MSYKTLGLLIMLLLTACKPKHEELIYVESDVIADKVVFDITNKSNKQLKFIRDPADLLPRQGDVLEMVVYEENQKVQPCVSGGHGEIQKTEILYKNSSKSIKDTHSLICHPSPTAG